MNPPRRLGRLGAVGLFLLLLILLPVGGVAVHGVVPPLTTFLMVEQKMKGQGVDYRWRGLNDISPRLVEAVIASEDANFCAHDGFDMKAIEKAMADNARGRRTRGGSTISQQTAKNVFLWSGRNWIRKGLEAGYTVLIETFWSKRRIVEVYLNVAEWAPGVYGAEAAAQHWFGKSAADLTPREAARLRT
jgi:monofunctional glycosyltransferase